MREASISSTASGRQSPIVKLWLSTRVPGLSSVRMRGRSARLTSGSRYMVTTLASRSGARNRSWRREGAGAARGGAGGERVRGAHARLAQRRAEQVLAAEAGAGLDAGQAGGGEGLV